jgi:hypothetical protein
MEKLQTPISQLPLTNIFKFKINTSLELGLETCNLYLREEGGGGGD